MPHDPTITPGPENRWRRTGRRGRSNETCAATGSWLQKERSIGDVGPENSMGRHSSVSQPPRLRPSIAQALSHYPHSTDIRPRFPPCQICRRWMASIQQPQTLDFSAVHSFRDTTQPDRWECCRFVGRRARWLSSVQSSNRTSFRQQLTSVSLEGLGHLFGRPQLRAASRRVRSTANISPSTPARARRM